MMEVKFYADPSVTCALDPSRYGSDHFLVFADGKSVWSASTDGRSIAFLEGHRIDAGEEAGHFYANSQLVPVDDMPPAIYVEQNGNVVSVRGERDAKALRRSMPASDGARLPPLFDVLPTLEEPNVAWVCVDIDPLRLAKFVALQDRDIDLGLRVFVPIRPATIVSGQIVEMKKTPAIAAYGARGIGTMMGVAYAAQENSHEDAAERYKAVRAKIVAAADAAGVKLSDDKRLSVEPASDDADVDD